MATRITKQTRPGGEMDQTSDTGAADAVPEEAKATARLFPSGTNALFKMVNERAVALEPNDPVTLINVSLSEVHVRTVNEAIKNPKGFEEKTVAIRPFGHITMPALHARRALDTQEKPGGDPRLVVQPGDGDCRGEHTFTGFGKPFRTCPFLNCKTHGPAPANVRWSIFQAQHRISKLGTEPAIRRVIETIDPRNEVVLWGLEIITQRLRSKQERLGVVGNVNPAEVTF